jgi:hypothetical protein
VPLNGAQLLALQSAAKIGDQADVRSGTSGKNVHLPAYCVVPHS